MCSNFCGTPYHREKKQRFVEQASDIVFCPESLHTASTWTVMMVSLAFVPRPALSDEQGHHRADSFYDRIDSSSVN